LLEVWIGDYPWDFAVPSANHALTALIHSIISKTYLLAYGSEFLQFLHSVPTLDKDAAWALKLPMMDESDNDNSDDADADDDASEHGHSAVTNSSPSVLRKRSLPNVTKGSMAMTMSRFITSLLQRPVKWCGNELVLVSRELDK